jgi:hypothetical protein
MVDKLHSFKPMLLIIFIPLLLSCASTNSPSQVVVAAYMAANEGKYSEAEKYMSSGLINAIKEGEGVKGVWDKTTRNGTIQKIEIREEFVRKEFGAAIVHFGITFKDGKTLGDSEILIKEGGQWKIHFSP